MYSFAPMGAHTAALLADAWRYPPPYDFYNMTADPEDYDDFVDPTLWPAHFLKVLECGELGVLLYRYLQCAGDSRV